MLYAKKETLLKVYNASLVLGGKQILRDINFEIKDIVRPDIIQGQVVALVGQSGAGKSTLFSLLSGLRSPNTGTISRLEVGNYHGSETRQMIPVQIGDMGVVYQNYYFYTWRKVRSILKMTALKNPDNKGKDINPIVTEIATNFGIAEHLDKFANELSGGQQQRVAIAEQILGGSEFLLLDEPFSGLDVLMKDKAVAMLQHVSCVDELKTLVLVSHDLESAVAIADAVYVLAKEKDKAGGTIVKEIDLISRDLAWHPEVKEMPAFKETIKEIKSLL